MQFAGKIMFTMIVAQPCLKNTYRLNLSIMVLIKCSDMLNIIENASLILSKHCIFADLH